MRPGSSLFLLVLGGILRFAVTDTVSGFDIHAVGMILMIAGAAGAILSMAWLSLSAERRRAFPSVAEVRVLRERDLRR
jgi:hypothetical protein